MSGSDKYLQALKKGNKSLFEDLYREYYVPLCYFCIKYVDSLEDAEEIVQDVFVRLWEKREEIEINTSLKSYLHKSVANSALNFIKKQKLSNKFKKDKELDSGVSFDDGLKNMEDEELQKVLKAAILELPEKRREIFELSRFEDMKYNKIAEHLSISVKTVENQMSKALKYLRIVLKDYTPVLAVAYEIIRSISSAK